MNSQATSYGLSSNLVNLSHSFLIDCEGGSGITSNRDRLAVGIGDIALQC